MPKAKNKLSRPSRSPFRSFPPTSEDEHPIDALVARRLPRGLGRRIERATSHLLHALGERRLLWLTLEELLSERSGHREEAYFNVGFEHGFAAGRAAALQETSGVDSRIEQLAAVLRMRALLHGELQAEERLRAVLLTAWSL